MDGSLTSYLYNHSTEILMTIDLQGVICDVNDRFLQQSGYRREEVLGNAISDFLVGGKGALPIDELDGCRCYLRGRAGVTDASVQVIHTDDHDYVYLLLIGSSCEQIPMTNWQYRKTEHLLVTVSQAMRRLVSIRDLDQKIAAALTLLGQNTSVNRIVVAEFHRPQRSGELLLSQRYTWRKDDAEVHQDNPELQNLPVHQIGLTRWYAELSGGHSIIGPLNQLPEQEQQFLKSFGINMFLAEPVFVQQQLWGVIAYDEDGISQPWMAGAATILKALAAGIGSAIEHVQNDEKLRQLYQAVQQSADSVVITNIDGNIEYVNDKFILNTGYGLDEIIGHNPRILKSGEQLPEVYVQLWQTISNGGEWRGEFHNKRKNGELYWEAVTISPIRNSKGVITHYLGTKEDITTRKQVQEALIEQQKFTETLLQNLAVPTYVIDRDHRVVIWNKACEDLTGVKLAAILSKGAGMAFYAGGQSCLADFVIEGQDASMVFGYAVCRPSEFGHNGLHAERWLTINGKKRYLIFNACPIYNGTGDLVAAVETIQDVSERKYAEERLERDLKLAGRMQKTFLPSSGGGKQIEVRYIYEPYHHVSGDLFDYQWNFDHTILSGAMIDVMGHGLPTALQTASLRVLFRQMSEKDLPLTERLAAINFDIMPYFQDDSLAAAIYFQFDFTRRVFSYASAGINYFLCSCAALPRLVKVPGPFLGLLPNSIFESHSVHFEPGDTFYFLSDGLFDVLPAQLEWRTEDMETMMNMFQQLIAEQRCYDDASVICFRICE